MDPSWSPDGKQLASGRVPWLVSNQEKIAIQVLDLGSRRLWTIPGSENLFARVGLRMVNIWLLFRWTTRD